MSLLDHPDAQALVADATLTPEAVDGCQARLTAFLQRYLPQSYRIEHRAQATTVIRGLVSGLERKTGEPSAKHAGRHRKTLQTVVGSGAWDDEAVMTEVRPHVRVDRAESDGVVVIDPSAVPKKGTESCGVARPWCGRRGTVDHGPGGVFLASAATTGDAPLERRLDLPEDWAEDQDRRSKCHVPATVQFQEKWQIALDLLDRSLPGLPQGGIVGADAFGRASEVRAKLRQRQERDLLDVPCTTTVRALERRRPPRKKAGIGRNREVPFVRAAAWAQSQPESRGTRLTVRAGAKGPLPGDALTVRVRANEDGRIGPEDRLVVLRPVGASRIDSALSHAAPAVPLTELVGAQRQRHRIEELIAAGTGAAGLDHYEVRSWVGWHHHITLAMGALWFWCLERRRVGGETPGDHGLAPAAGVPSAPATPGAEPRADRGGGHARSAAS